MAGIAASTKVDPDMWRALTAGRFKDLPAVCRSTTEPGLTDSETWRDWADRPTTPDQLRIEDYLDAQDLHGRRILHIGLGNSSLAKRFIAGAAEIVGTTVVQHEVDHARSLGMERYSAFLNNKYAASFDGPTGRFDYIVDNNPTTFCCCLTHFANMLEFYADSLAEAGQLVTDRVGLGWAHIPEGNPRWAFDFEDLAAAGAAVGLTASRVDRNVYVLSRKPLEPLPAAARLKWQLNKLGRRLARAWR